MQASGSGGFPLAEVLRDSLYYPACGTDGDPVQELPRLAQVGAVHSFIYADYAVGEAEVLRQLHDPKLGFKGYRVVFTRPLPEEALAQQGWLPLAVGRRDGDPNRYDDAFKPSFILWAVFERDGSKMLREPWGPERFSLLYIGRDGVETYQNLFNQNHCRPKVIAVIQPGTAFGHNWTDFNRADGILCRMLHQNPAGLPEFLLEGAYRGQLQHSGNSWRGTVIQTWATRHHGLRLWRLSGAIPHEYEKFLDLDLGVP